jgi:hypothetical protein
VTISRQLDAPDRTICRKVILKKELKDLKTKWLERASGRRLEPYILSYNIMSFSVPE